jgi:hypothetical protein
MTSKQQTDKHQARNSSGFKSPVTDLVKHIHQEANILQVFNLAGELDIGIPADRHSQVESVKFFSRK